MVCTPVRSIISPYRRTNHALSLTQEQSQPVQLGQLKTGPNIKSYVEPRMTWQAKRIGWMNDLRFYVLFNSISRQWAGDNERLCAKEPRSRLKRSQAGLEF